jgi:hypothetical protein
MTLVADSSTVVVAASPAGLLLLVAIWATVAVGVFAHARRSGNRHALLWGIAAFIPPITIAVGVIYVARVWWNQGGKHHFTPR